MYKKKTPQVKTDARKERALKKLIAEKRAKQQRKVKMFLRNVVLAHNNGD